MFKKDNKFLICLFIVLRLPKAEDGTAWRARGGLELGESLTDGIELRTRLFVDIVLIGKDFINLLAQR